MSDIFISYASADRARVKPLVDVLQREGWSVWWDRTIPPGKTWDQVIESAIQQARCVVVLWSKASVASEWVRLEAHDGKQRGILIPAKIDNIEPPFAFRMIQAASLVDWRGERDHAELTELLREVESLVPRRVQAAAEPAKAPPKAAVNPIPPRPDLDIHLLYPRHPRGRGRGRAVTFAAVGLLAFAGLAVWQPWRPGPQKREPRVQPPSPTQSDLNPGSTKVNPKDGLEYVWIPPGQFQMGCSPGDSECDGNEKPAHPVTITRGFWMGKTEVTEAPYNRSVGKAGGSERMPKVNVDWNEAKTYCEWAGLRLPAEAEWEYAARAGSSGARYGALNDIAWHNGNSGGKLHPVAVKKANAWGLYDMLGNAWEWAQDWYDEGYYKASASADPPGPPTGKYRTLRGGSWYVYPRSTRASNRVRFVPALRGNYVGFRCSGELR